MTELEELKHQAQTLLQRIYEIEKKQQDSETFEGILEMLESDVDGLEHESIEELEKISQNSYLYERLKRIELYINKKFGGKIDWNNDSRKYGVYYDYESGKINNTSNNVCIQGLFYLVSDKARKYFIKVAGDKLIEFFKTTH